MKPETTPTYKYEGQRQAEAAQDRLQRKLDAAAAMAEALREIRKCGLPDSYIGQLASAALAQWHEASGKGETA